ncbi:hypothetical protein [Bacillus paralicheniformis]|uniref:hypothetical protein n=1 Tax=Bacillus paralicheniformis TaxID=1648923 RepID=UPI0011A3B637|nr:hypothetical protein [Bacillus paralicheniformis]
MFDPKAIAFKIGDRVRAESIMHSGVGTIMYINEKQLHWQFYPIQVELDEPDGDGHKLMRFNLKEVTKL